MAKRHFYIIVTFLLFVLVGCESNSEKVERKIKGVHSEIKAIIESTDLSDYIEGDISFKQTEIITSEEKKVFMFNIIVPISPSYLDLDSSKRYELLGNTTQEIFDYQGDDNRLGMPKGMPLETTNEERIKHQSIILEIGNEEDTYTISLDNEEVRETRVDNEGVLNNVVFADVKDESYVIFKNGNVLNEGEYEVIGNYANRKKEVDQSTSSSNKLSNWNSLSETNKTHIVSSILSKLSGSGFEVNSDESYFVAALDAFYEGGHTNNTTIEEAIKLVGFSGGVISQ